jgi:hypothetical protein
MLFWANAHGAFVVGLLLLLAYAAGETLRLLLRQPRALSRPQLRTLYLVAAAGAAATLLNPRGLGLYGYVGTLVGNETIQGLVTEWQPPDPRTIAGGAFALGLLALLACFGLGRRRPTITDVLLVCGLGWMALSSARHVVWFGIVAMPIAAQALAAPRSPLAAPARRAVFAPMNAVVALLLLLPVVVVQPWIKTALPLPEPYQALFAELPGAPQLFSSDTPVAAAEHLRSQPCPGHLFSELGYSSYFIWALPTPAQVFVDPRFELFPDQVWQDYITISQGRDLAALQARYQIACVALDKIYQPRLATAIASDPSWVRTFPNSGQESRSEVWRRR